MPDEVRVDDLVDLWRAGAVQLPQVGVQYAELSRAMHKTALSQEAAFRRSIGGLGRLYSAWTSLRSTLQDEVAVRSHNNLISAGEALMRIADSYATTDYLNSDQISDYQQDIEEIQRATDVEDRPPYVPDAPSSSDDHPEQAPMPTGGSF